MRYCTPSNTPTLRARGVADRKVFSALSGPSPPTSRPKRPGRVGFPPHGAAPRCGLSVSSAATGGGRDSPAICGEPFARRPPIHSRLFAPENPKPCFLRHPAGETKAANARPWRVTRNGNAAGRARSCERDHLAHRGCTKSGRSIGNSTAIDPPFPEIYNGRIRTFQLNIFELESGKTVKSR